MDRSAIINRINQLPKGYISKKTINGKEYNYLQWKENGKVKSKYIKASELESYIAFINERKQLEIELESSDTTLYRNHSIRINQYASKLFMSSRQFSIGCQDFEELIIGNAFYIDKTDFINRWWQTGDKVTLITRPRRFGKTLNMSMINCFFSIQYNNRSDLFKDLIINHNHQLMDLQGTYPALFISFGSVKGSNLIALMNQLNNAIRSSIFPYIDTINKACTDNVISTNDLDSFLRLYYSDSFDSTLSLLSLCFKLLNKIYNRKIIILLDEYDTPMIEAWLLGVWNECADNIRSLFNLLFKTNNYLERGLLTGITRITKESFFSDLNNLRVYGMTSNKYSDCFGFTQTEVVSALSAQCLDTFEEVKSWYDGFIIGNTENMYNPWSIVNYLSDKEFHAYWVNTSSNRLISDLFMCGSQDLKMSLEDLINGKPISSVIDETMILNDLYTHDYAIWSLLFSSGYIKPISKNGDYFKLIPTNKEVEILLPKLISRWFEGMNSYNLFIKALFQNDLEYMNKYMNSISQSIISYFDTSSGNSEPEKFYHGLVLGLLVTQQDNFIITSNRESGFGRYDIIMKPHNPKENHAIIIEFKVKSLSEDDLTITAKRALEQIKEKAYATELINSGIDPSNIYEYGFAFEGKNVLIL